MGKLFLGTNKTIYWDTRETNFLNVMCAWPSYKRLISAMYSKGNMLNIHSSRFDTWNYFSFLLTSPSPKITWNMEPVWTNQSIPDWWNQVSSYTVHFETKCINTVHHNVEDETVLRVLFYILKAIVCPLDISNLYDIFLLQNTQDYILKNVGKRKPWVTIDFLHCFCVHTIEVGHSHLIQV